MSKLSNNTTSLQSILERINNLPEAGSGGIELPELTNAGSAADLLEGKELIDQYGSKVTGTIPKRTGLNLSINGARVTIPSGYYAAETNANVGTTEQAIPSISVDANGKITASASQTKGYVEAGTKSSTKQLTIQAAKTITPTKSSQTAVAKNVYTTGVVTVEAIPNEYITTTDATAEAAEIFAGETAYVNGEKKIGTFTIDSELNTQDNLITQIQAALEGKASSTEPVLQSKEVTPNTSSQVVEPDAGYDGLSNVTVNAIPSEYVVPAGTLAITTNGLHDVKNYAFAEISIAGSGGESSEEINALMNGTITSFTDNQLTQIKGGAFFDCTKLATVDVPLCSKINNYAFQNCSSLTSVNFPVCKAINLNAFANCINLISIDIPQCSQLGNYAFSNCGNLNHLNAPSLTSIGAYTLSGCKNLSSLSFSKLNNIGGGAFSNCHNLISLYLMSTSVCRLQNSTAFTSSPIGGYSTVAGVYGTIYVPASLLSSYLASTNWAYFSSRIVGI